MVLHSNICIFAVLKNKLIIMPAVTKNTIDFSLKNKVKDMSLAAWGRKEIKLAEAEMPGLTP